MSTLLDPELLNRLATVLILVVVARIASDRWPFDLWFFGAYSLAFGAVAIGLLVGTATTFRIEVFLFGLAIVGGLYWTGLARPGRRLRLPGHAFAAACAMALAGILALVAMHYHWWVAPLLLLGMMATGLVVNHAIPALRGWQDTALPVTPAAALADVERIVRRSPETIPAKCASCGLVGAVPGAWAGRTVPCPRCRSPVKVLGPSPFGRPTGPGIATAPALPPAPRVVLQPAQGAPPGERVATAPHAPGAPAPAPVGSSGLSQVGGGSGTAPAAPTRTVTPTKDKPASRAKGPGGRAAATAPSKASQPRRRSKQSHRK